MKSKLKISGINTALAYPKLMKSDEGCVVLFTGDSQGMLVHSGKTRYPIGEYENDDWDMGAFTDLPKGSTVTLTQTGE